jgi:uracil-DNA glycosylase family 4
MEPVKRGRVGARVENQVGDWLRYGEDLGLGPYYRDRAPLYGTAESVSVISVDSPIVSADSTPIVMAARRAADVSANAALLAPQKSSLAAKASPIASTAAILPVVAGPTLFEGMDRIEGDTLTRIREDIGDCTRCKLHKGRTKIVFGVGNPNADLMFVGEGPGRDEDLSGEPFVGRAGKLLTDMIKAMGLQREDVYIANVVKCRPPENRLPEKDEITTCSPFLMRQIDSIKPKVICTLGSCSAQTLLQTTTGISKLRGEWFDFRGAKLMPTYHPAYLLRNPAAKPEVWKDLQKVMAALGLQPKKR